MAQNQTITVKIGSPKKKKRKGYRARPSTPFSFGGPLSTGRLPPISQRFAGGPVRGVGEYYPRSRTAGIARRTKRSARKTIKAGREVVSAGRQAYAFGKSAVSAGRKAYAFGKSAVSAGRKAGRVIGGSVKKVRTIGRKSPTPFSKGPMPKVSKGAIEGAEKARAKTKVIFGTPKIPKQSK